MARAENRRKVGAKVRVINWMDMESLDPGFLQSLILSLCSPRCDLMKCSINKAVMFLHVFLLYVYTRKKRKRLLWTLSKIMVENIQRKRERLKIKCIIVYKPRLNLSYFFIHMALAIFFKNILLEALFKSPCPLNHTATAR